MAELWSGHFDSTPDDPRMLLAEKWANYIKTFISNGILNGGTNMQVTAGSGMRVRVDEGRANIEGYIGILEEDSDGRFYDVDIPPSNPVNPRIDRIILRLDRSLAVRRITIEVLQGSAGSNPVPPALTRNNIIWELSLARVRVAAQAPGITAANITDERFDEEVCGLINSILGLDSSVWQAQFDAFMDSLKSRDEEFIAEQWEKFTTQMESQQAVFNELLSEMKLLFSAQETLTFTRINNNFDDLSVRRGCDRVTVFNDDGSIMESLRIVALDFLLATRETVFNDDDSITESVEFNPFEFTDGNVVISTTAFSLVKRTVFEADGSIVEVIR